MKKRLLLSFLALSCLCHVFASVTKICNEPDSAYLFSYATQKDANHNGLHFAWSIDRESWHPIGPEYGYIRSDFGKWGAEKRMLSPVVFQDREGVWHVLFSLNERVGTFAHASSADLVNWRPQSYPTMTTDGNCMSLEVAYSASENNYRISWVSTEGSKGVFYTTTRDFKTYTPAKPASGVVRVDDRSLVQLSGEEQNGMIQKVSWPVIDGLIKACEFSTYKQVLYGENTSGDSMRFPSLQPVNAAITIHPSQSKAISDMLIGIFFEDINYAADGGIYAELIQNRDFEYTPADREGRDESWNSTKAWSLIGEKTSFTIGTHEPIHPNNPHYAVLEIAQPGASLTNEGFSGIPVKSGDAYDFSLFSRMLQGKGGKLIVRLVATDGTVCGQAMIHSTATHWKKQEVTLRATHTEDNARLEILPQFSGTVALDMISLFPQKTFKGRKNGLRQDLAQTLADMNPRFVRFPGGCVAHGDGLDNMYRWKNTIGPLEARKPQPNLWRYHQTAGLGYFEYFQFCEDMGAEPLPVLPAGVPCQNSGTGGDGQQCGIPMHEMHDYIQEVLDLIEWANGDAKTTFGKKRAEAGHPKPFNLKYIGIGNEDLISDVFEERYTLICNAVKEKYPEIIICGTVGPFSEGSDYVEGWRIATEIGLPMVDEHYYQPPGWYIHNQDYYDRYDRNKSKVYLGEYAAHLPGRPSNIETALAEALHLINVERNGDVVSLTSYAPLLAKEGFTQWSPDLIYFNNTEVKPTVGYYVQKLYGQNSGDEYLNNSVQLSNTQDGVKKRVAVSSVRDTKSGDLIVKLVNFLPVSVKPSFTFSDIALSEAAVVTKSVLQGRPDDKVAKPMETTCSVLEMMSAELPAYSFTVYRIKTK